MSKSRNTILILGIVILCIVASLVTFFLLSSSGLIVTDPIELVYTVGDVSDVYSGTPLTPKRHVLIEGKLLKGHREEARYVGSQTEVGTGDADVDIKILDEDGYDVTKNYLIRTVKGHLNVEKRPVTVRLDGNDVIYNGADTPISGFTITDGGIVKGQTLKLTCGNITSAGVLTARAVKPAVYDCFGYDVTDNYEITVEGSINVLSRPITVRPLGAEKVYDGAALTCGGYEISEGTLMDGDNLRADYVNDTITDAGTLVVEFDGIAIYDKDGKNVTDNYYIKEETAVLKVTPRPVTVTAPDGKWVFDGTEHAADTEKTVFTGLPKDFYAVSAFTDESAITYIGDADNIVAAASITVTNTDGDTVDNGNFDFTFKNGTLIVTPLKIDIELKAIGKEYDGLLYSYDAGNPFYTCGELPDGYELKHDELIFADAAVNEGIFGSGNAGVTTYYVAPKYFNISCGGIVRTDNFEITVINNTINISKKTVNVRLDDLGEIIYGDYKPVTKNNITLAPVTLPAGMTLDCTSVYAPQNEKLNVGSYNYSADFNVYNNVKNVTANFVISVTGGSFEITPRPVVLDYERTVSKIYGESAVIDFTRLQILNPDTRVPYNNYTVVKADCYEQDNVLRIFNPVIKDAESNSDVTANFAVEECSKNITVSRRTLKFAVDNVTVNYTYEMFIEESMPYVSENLWRVSTETPLNSGDKIVAGVTTYAAGGTVYLDISDRDIRIENAAGVNVTAYYDFSGNDDVTGSVSINKCTINVALKSVTINAGERPDESDLFGLNPDLNIGYFEFIGLENVSAAGTYTYTVKYTGDYGNYVNFNITTGTITVV